MKAVIFDFNGTLFNDYDKHLKVWNKISQLLRGKDLEACELYRNCNEVPNKKIVEYLSDKVLDEQQLENYSNMKEAYYQSYCSMDREHFHLIKGAYAYFDKDLIVYDDGRYQNKVEMFKQAAKNINVDLKDCIIFEDSESGIKAAYEAGCRKIVL